MFSFLLVMRIGRHNSVHHYYQIKWAKITFFRVFDQIFKPNNMKHFTFCIIFNCIIKVSVNGCNTLFKNTLFYRYFTFYYIFYWELFINYITQILRVLALKSHTMTKSIPCLFFSWMKSKNNYKLFNSRAF